MIEEHVQVVSDTPRQPIKGSAGLRTQMPGAPTTVSGVAQATGGVGHGNFIETDTK